MTIDYCPIRGCGVECNYLFTQYRSCPIYIKEELNELDICERQELDAGKEQVSLRIRDSVASQGIYEKYA